MSVEMQLAFSFLTRNGRRAAQLFAAGGKVSVSSFEAAACGGLTLAVPYVREFLAQHGDCAPNCLEMACHWHLRCGRAGECRARTAADEDRADHFAYAEAAIEFGAPPTAQALALAAWPRGEALAAAIQRRWGGTAELEAATADLRAAEARGGEPLAALSGYN